MLTLTRKSDYALVALAYLASQAAAGDVAGQSISARQIASRFNLPLPLLMNILKSLAGAGLLASSRGPQGGYTLALDPRRISVLDVVHAIEGPVRMTLCTLDDEDDAIAAGHECCPATEQCPIKGPIHRLNDRLQQFLASVAVADLIEEDPQAHSQHGRGSSFSLATLGKSEPCACHREHARPAVAQPLKPDENHTTER